MEIEICCPCCGGTARFSSARRTSRGRLVGRCDACCSVLSLHGGHLSILEARPDPAGVRWPFADLVARGRRAAVVD
ncbi:MAG TPA: hypothetical protein VNS19_13815 [Acidimicrobiales bacterium]|nr:hypothetical protein [Acidimicrobiales bacterium]